MDVLTLRGILQEPTLDIKTHANWGSHNPDHRNLIKKALGEIPGLKSSSISHTLGLGGFAYVMSDAVQVGFDIEEITRATDPVVRRVCKSDEEFSRAPSAGVLWTAKEATFKALRGSLQPQVISEVVIGGWKKVDSQFDTFSAEAPFSNAYGVSGRFQNHVYSICLIKVKL